MGSSTKENNEGVAQAVEKIVEIIAKLRDPITGCPWDKEQTHESLKPYFIEETYEALEAIDLSPTALKEELGDVLLQILLHAQIAAEKDQFNFTEIMVTLAEKLIRRHPHVFADGSAKTSEDVKKRWEEIKQEDKLRQGNGATSKSILDGVPRSLPALLRAYRVGEKAAGVGFDWEKKEDVLAKVKEELEEFLTEVNASKSEKKALEEEFGDLLFSLVQYGRKAELDCEAILNRTVEKFIFRFKKMEDLAERPISECSLVELELLWQSAKKILKKVEKNEGEKEE